MSVASEITRLQNAKASLKTSINAKTDSSHKITTETLEDYSGFVDSIATGGSGDVVNGIIEQYKAETSTISANTFVEFVNKTTITTGTDTRLSTGTGIYENISAVALSDTKVFIIHRNDDYLYGIVCTISGTTITIGTDTQLITTLYAYLGSSAVALSENKVFITHRNDGYLYGMVCTISDTTITTETDIQLSTGSSSYNYTKSVALNDSKVFIVHQSDSNNKYLNGMVCTISDTTITVGTDTQLSSNPYSVDGSRVAVLNDTKVFIAHRGANGYLYGMVCTISDTTITAGTDTQLSTETSAYEGTSAVALSSSKVFITHRGGGTNGYLYGMVCTISDTTITAGTDTRLSTGSNSYLYASAVALNDSKVFIAHRNSSYLYGIVCTIDTDTLKVSDVKIDGITKTECTTSTVGDVWVLNS